MAGSDPRQALRKADALKPADVAGLQADLAKLDGTRGGPPWTTACLRLIGEAEGRTAGELAAQLGFDKPVLKRKIRQLKELGLTESLQAGYRLSRRGSALLRAIDQR